jgi:hypothetical protein
LIADSTNVFARSSQVTGKIYASDYADPTPANLTTAVLDMEAAYTDAAGRTLPDFTELYAGDLSGRTLAPGLYKWSTGVQVTTQVTLTGPSQGVWIFQIAGDLTLGSGARVVLSGGAQAKKVFWQVGGGTGVEIGTTAHVEGSVLAEKAIHLRTGASLNGRALSQTAVTLDQNRVVLAYSSREIVFISDGALDGYVLESAETSSLGGTRNATAPIFRLGDDATNKQFRAILSFNTAGLPNAAVVTEATLMIRRKALIGTDPFGTHGPLLADINGRFGSSTGLEIGDFEALAGATAIATFDPVPDHLFYSAGLNTQGRSLVNRVGPTQFRLYFTADDNNDLIADNMKFASGNALAAQRPKLRVRYFVP